MIRTIITADTTDFTLSLPNDFLGKKIEVIAFIIDEVKTKSGKSKPAKTFSAVQLSTGDFKFNRDEANER